MADAGGKQGNETPPSPSASTRARARTGNRSRLPLERLVTVEKMLFAPDNMPHRKVELTLAKRWKVTRRTVREYIRRVYEDLKEASEENRETRRACYESRFEDVYRAAMKAGEQSAAVQALDRLAKLGGLYPSEQLTVSAHVTATAAVLPSDADKDRARLEELRQREAEAAKKDGGGGA